MRCAKTGMQCTQTEMRCTQTEMQRIPEIRAALPRNCPNCCNPRIKLA
jgi:hypothetical protein